jgi:cell division septal protein FtsQ
VKRALAALAVVIVLAVAVYWLFLRSDGSTPEAAPVAPPHAVARIGEGSKAIAVDQRGNLSATLKLPKKPPLPQLPLKAPPKSGRVKGPVLEEVEVLAAAPPALSPYLASTSYDEKEGGVKVETTAGIELRFGDASQAKKKWAVGAAILANPAITTLDYVDLEAPSKPAFGGEGHELPPAP